MNGAWNDLLVAQLFRSPFRRRRRGQPGFLARWWRGFTRRLRWGTRRTSKDYARFIASPAWRAQRARVLRRDGYRCRDCFTARAREAHHEVYFRPLAKTPDAHIVSLCPDCHHGRHHPASGGRGPTSRRFW